MFYFEPANNSDLTGNRRLHFNFFFNIRLTTAYRSVYGGRSHIRIPMRQLRSYQCKICSINEDRFCYGFHLVSCVTIKWWCPVCSSAERLDAADETVKLKKKKNQNLLHKVWSVKCRHRFFFHQPYRWRSKHRRVLLDVEIIFDLFRRLLRYLCNLYSTNREIFFRDLCRY